MASAVMWPVPFRWNSGGRPAAVSYTHLDVYKRQIYTRCRSLTIDFETHTNLNSDGEMSESTHVEAAIVPLALPLILPKRKD